MTTGIKVVSIRKVREEEQPVLNDGRLKLIWIYNVTSQLEQFEEFVKTEIKDRVKLIKSQRLDAIKKHHPKVKEEPCLVLLDQVYDSSLLNIFKEQKLHVIIFNASLEDNVQDYKLNKVHFLTNSEKKLIEYVKKFLERVVVERNSEEIRPEMRQSLELAQKLSNMSNGRKQLPKIEKSPKKKEIVKEFVTGWDIPGPGAYQNVDNFANGTSAVFPHARKLDDKYNNNPGPGSYSPSV